MWMQINTDSNGSSDGDSELFLSKTQRQKCVILYGVDNFLSVKKKHEKIQNWWKESAYIFITEERDLISSTTQKVTICAIEKKIELCLVSQSFFSSSS